MNNYTCKIYKNPISGGGGTTPIIINMHIYLYQYLKPAEIVFSLN